MMKYIISLIAFLAGWYLYEWIKNKRKRTRDIYIEIVRTQSVSPYVCVTFWSNKRRYNMAFKKDEFEKLKKGNKLIDKLKEIVIVKGENGDER